jgi:hypothetical protein
VQGEVTFPFEFNNVDTALDSYRGSTVRLRYVLRVTVSKGVGGFTEEFPIWVQNVSRSPPEEVPIKVRPAARSVNTFPHFRHARPYHVQMSRIHKTELDQKPL